MRSCVLVFKSSIRYSCRILITLELCRRISKKYSLSALMKILPVVAETDGRTDKNRETDGRTDMTKLIVAFSSFAKTHKKYQVHQAEPPMCGKAKYIWEVAWYPRARLFRQTRPLPSIR